MKALYWNARGMGNSPTRRVLKRFVRLHKPAMICISEPFIPLSAITSSFWRSLNLFPIATNDRGSSRPNLWLLCDPNVSPQVISATAQQLTVTCVLDSVLCVFSWVYAKTTYIERRQLWIDLATIKSSHGHYPWVAVGDFNCVLGAHEKRGGCLPNSLSCSEFQLMSSTCELIHFPTRGLPYTWVRRGITRNVEMRLDRCLGNDVWMDA